MRQSCNQLLGTLPKIRFSKYKIIIQCCYFPGELKGDNLSSSHVAAAGAVSSQGFSPQGRTQSRPVPLRQGLFSLTGEGLQLVQQISITSSRAGIAFPGLLQPGNRGRPFNSASNGFILQPWGEQKHLYLLPSALDIFCHLSVLPSPLWHPKVATQTK